MVYNYKTKEVINMNYEEIKEIIYNSNLDYSNLSIQNGTAKGYITVLIDETDFTNEEIKELINMPYFYLDHFEVDINKYYKEALKVERLNKNELIEYSDIEFKFSISRKEVA
jgi:hypothetical protein